MRQAWSEDKQDVFLEALCRSTNWSWTLFYILRVTNEGTEAVDNKLSNEKKVNDRLNVWNHWQSQFQLTGPPFTSLSTDGAITVKCLAQARFDITFSDCQCDTLATRLTWPHNHIAELSQLYLDLDRLIVSIAVWDFLSSFGTCCIVRNLVCIAGQADDYSVQYVSWAAFNRVSCGNGIMVWLSLSTDRRTKSLVVYEGGAIHIWKFFFFHFRNLCQVGISPSGSGSTLSSNWPKIGCQDLGKLGTSSSFMINVLLKWSFIFIDSRPTAIFHSLAYVCMSTMS